MNIALLLVLLNNLWGIENRQVTLLSRTCRNCLPYKILCYKNSLYTIFYFPLNFIFVFLLCVICMFLYFWNIKYSIRVIFVTVISTSKQQFLIVTRHHGMAASYFNENNSFSIFNIIYIIILILLSSWA